MGIEKITGGIGMTYQGNSAVLVSADSGRVAQSEGTPVQMKSTAEPLQDFSLDSEKSEDMEQPKESVVGQGSQLKSAVDDLNKQMKNSEAIFGIHDKTNRVTIKIVDKESKEVLKEYPPEQTLDMIAKVWEIAGILVDEKR